MLSFTQLTEIATRVAYGAGHPDVASDFLWEAWSKEWEFETAREAEKRVGMMCKYARLNSYKSREPCLSDLASEDDTRRFLETALGSIAPNQINHCLAQEARALIPHLPNDQRRAMEVLAEDGTPFDVAEELGIGIRDAIILVKDARRNIHLIDDEIEKSAGTGGTYG